MDGMDTGLIGKAKMEIACGVFQHLADGEMCLMPNLPVNR